MSQSDTPVPTMPLPDFFIGAHAKIMGGISPLRTAAGSIPTSLLFLSKFRNEVRGSIDRHSRVLTTKSKLF